MASLSARVAGARALCGGRGHAGGLLTARDSVASRDRTRRSEACPTFRRAGGGGAGDLDRPGPDLARLPRFLAVPQRHYGHRTELAARDFWLFHNGITGIARSSLPVHLKSNPFFITVRVLESAILVPVLEELFWRGWLMRWVIRPDFESVPLGQYTALSFWAVALLFATEHGPYWEVGLIAGVSYNWWLVRTRNLADCMLAHAVTNALLAGYVLVFDQWQYWL